MALTRQQYQERAYQRAFGDQGDDWLPMNGFSANRPRLIKLYEYYKMLFNTRPDRFLWAGLGRMAGGAVVSGLDLMVTLPFSDPTPITCTMIEIGKQIFEDLAWLHEAFLDDPATAIALCAARDITRPARRSYAEALTQIASGIQQQVVAGNKALLEIEQFSIIQPLYDRLRPPSLEWGVFRLARTVTSNVHPYHKDFLTSFPNLMIPKDITVAADRWEWITLQGGMWEKWAEGFRGSQIGVSPAQRSGLVNLSFDKILRRDFSPIDQLLMPPGSQ